MKFKDLRAVTQDHTTIWLTESGSDNCLVANELRFIDNKYDDCEIKLMFPEKYPAISTSGITVYIDTESSEEDLNSCDGCKHYNDSYGDRSCGMCCRNYEEDFYEKGE